MDQRYFLAQMAGRGILFNPGSSHRGMLYSRMGGVDRYSGVPGIFGGYIQSGSGVAK